MWHPRVLWRLLSIFALCAVMYPFLLISSLALRGVARLRGRRPHIGRWQGRVFHRWCRWIGVLLGLRIETRGRPPQPPFLLVTNHLGYIDIILLASQLPCVFVAKAEVAGWPLLGPVCRSVGTLFIDRASKRDIPRVMREMEAVLEDGRGVIIFPEGTSSRGEKVERFLPSLLDAAARSGRPVCYGSLSYRTPPLGPPAHQWVCWWGNMPFFRHLVGLLRFPAIQATLIFGAEPIRDSDRKVLATRLQQAVQRQFRAVVEPGVASMHPVAVSVHNSGPEA